MTGETVEVRFRQSGLYKEYNFDDVTAYLLRLDPTRKLVRLSYTGKRDFRVIILNSFWEKLQEVAASIGVDWRPEDFIPEDFYSH